MADAKSGNFGTLSWGMNLDTKEFKKKMKDIRKNTKKFGQEMTDQFKTIAKGFAGVTAAAIAGGGGMLFFAKNSLAAVNAQLLLADSLGTTQAEVAGLDLAAQKFGVSQDMLIDKMREFGGIEEFKKIADQVKNAGDESAQLAKAQEILGNEGLKLLPILQQGAEGFARMKQEALDLGLALTPEQIAESRVAWEQYEDTILNIQGLGKQIGQAFLKPLGLISAAAEGFIKTFKTDIIGAFTFISESMSSLIMGAVDLFSRVGIPFINAFISFANQIGDTFQVLFDFLTPATNGAIGGLTSMFDTVTDFIATFKQSLIIGINKPIEFMIRGAFSLLDSFSRFIGKLILENAAVLTEAGLMSENMFQGISDAFVDQGAAIRKMGRDLAKPFADVQKEAEKEMVNILTDKFKKDQQQQMRFKGIVGEFTTNFGKALDKAAKVPGEVVAAALSASVSDKFAGLALSGSQAEASLKNDSRNRERFERNNIQGLAGIENAINNLEAV